MKKATQEEALAETWVFWDINKCPVPPGCDPRVVRGCIKRLLERNGYCGPLKVTAVGKLVDVPRDMLRGVYSSGIALTNVRCETSEIIGLIDVEDDPPPANVMVIAEREALPGYYQLLLMRRYNPLEPFPYDSLERLILENSLSGEFEEEEETVEPALWDCFVCARDPPGQGFENFITHLDSEEHLELSLLRDPKQVVLRPTTETKSFYPWAHVKSESEHDTFVFWDMNTCPVPPGCDPRRAGPCIKRFLENKGYSGRGISITAIGVLTEVPSDILRGVYSSGIALINNVFSSSSDLLFGWNPSPAKILVISNKKHSTPAFGLQSQGYNLLQPFPCDSLESLFLADSGPLEEDNCSESALWTCRACRHDGRGFENFANHVTSRRHERKLLDYLPANARFLRRENTPNHGDKAKVQQVCESVKAQAQNEVHSHAQSMKRKHIVSSTLPLSNRYELIQSEDNV